MTDRPKFRTSYFRSELETFDYQEGLIIKKQKTGVNNGSVDMQAFADTLQSMVEDMDQEGYDVMHIVPLQMGHIEPLVNKKQERVGEVGFSITQGAAIVGKLRK